ncbi:hypothetical protein [Lutimonas vermicola]|uniref:Uncharacterized protein n=1 Tax=Lutimonas vermicola TaxID=414288 RepID=A0ABU9L318_9FLAO
MKLNETMGKERTDEFLIHGPRIILPRPIGSTGIQETFIATMALI